MSDISNIDLIVHEILGDMPLKEKAAIANLDEDKVPYLQYAFDVCIRGQLGQDDDRSRRMVARKRNCNADYNIHRDPGFLLQNPAIPISGFLNLKSSFMQ